MDLALEDVDYGVWLLMNSPEELRAYYKEVRAVSHKHMTHNAEKFLEGARGTHIFIQHGDYTTASKLGDSIDVIPYAKLNKSILKDIYGY